MKKQLCKLAIFALLLSTASCADEQFAGDLTGGETTVTFNAQLPAGLQTRVAGDGLTATTLSYAVYEQGKDTGHHERGRGEIRERAGYPLVKACQREDLRLPLLG